MICSPPSSFSFSDNCWSVSKATKRKTISQDELLCKRQRTKHDSDCFFVTAMPELGARSQDKCRRPSNNCTFAPGNNTKVMLGGPSSPTIVISSGGRSASEATGREAVVKDDSGYDSDCVIVITPEPYPRLAARSKRSALGTKLSSGSDTKEMFSCSSTPDIILIPDSTTKCEAGRGEVSAADRLRREKRSAWNDDAVLLTFESTAVSVDTFHGYTDEGVSLSNKSNAHFEANYLQFDRLGRGGVGTVYAGLRRSDGLPVAIKHIPTFMAFHQTVTYNGKEESIPTEVLLMHKAAGEPKRTNGTSAAVGLLDWYDLQDTVVLVMERPVPCMDLRHYMKKNGPLDRADAKNSCGSVSLFQSIMRQLVDAAIDMRSKGIFHRDIKADNVLIERGRGGDLRVRIIDFGCGCSFMGVYYTFLGTYIYTPPEFYREGRYKAGPTTVWQLAALLAEMMGEVQLFTTRDFLNQKFQIGPTWSADHRDLLTKCLVIEPEGRATMDDMRLHPWLN